MSPHGAVAAHAVLDSETWPEPQTSASSQSQHTNDERHGAIDGEPALVEQPDAGNPSDIDGVAENLDEQDRRGREGESASPLPTPLQTQQKPCGEQDWEPAGEEGVLPVGREQHGIPSHEGPAEKGKCPAGEAGLTEEHWQDK